MKKKHTVCPACGSNVTREIVKNDAYPAILFPIEREKRFSVATGAIVVFGCDICNHMFLTEIDIAFNRSVYADYYYLYPYGKLESMERAYREPFLRVFDLFAPTGSMPTLLEVGCSSVEQLNYFQAMGYSCVGISPGADTKTSPVLIDGYYENYGFGQKFDGIVSRFNLEHIVHLDIFLKKAYAELKDGGAIFVQVPNIECFLAGGVVSVFAHEHPHYFCKSSLAAILTKCGFEVDFIKAELSDPSIIAVARKPRVGLRNYQRVLSNIRAVDTLIEIMDMYDNTVQFNFYGAGLTLAGLLYLDGRIARYSPQIFIIDDNSLIVGKYMPNTNLEVRSFSERIKEGRHVLFVFLNPIYHAQVIEKVRSSNFEDIFYLDGSGIHEVG